jgi:hypothetical protein
MLEFQDFYARVSRFLGYSEPYIPSGLGRGGIWCAANCWWNMCGGECAGTYWYGFNPKKIEKKVFSVFSVEI